MAGIATGGRGMGIHPSNIAGGVAAVNSTIAMSATTRLGGLANPNRHLNYHHHNQQHNPPGIGTGMVAYGIAGGSNLSSTSSSSGVGTITNNSSSNGSSSGATGTASTQAASGSNNSYNHQSLPRHFLRGGVPAQTTGQEGETNGLPSSGIVMGPSHHPHQPMNSKMGKGVQGQLDPQHTHPTHQFSTSNGIQQPLRHNGYPVHATKKSLNTISTVSNGLYEDNSPPLSSIPNSRFLNQPQINTNHLQRNNQIQQQNKNRALSSYYSTLRSQAPPPPLPSQNSSLYHQAVPANIISNGGESSASSAIQPPKQFDSYYYHPATVGRGSPALVTTGLYERQRPSSSGAVIDELDQVALPSSRSTSKIIGGNRVGYGESPSQSDSSHTNSHHHPPPRSSSAMSSHGINTAEYSVLKFNTNNIGTEIDV